MKIALISDTHLAACAPDFVANTKAALDWIGEAGAGLTLHLGDITAFGSEAPEQFEEAAAVFEGFAGEIRFLPGNHDVGDNPGETFTGKEPAVSAALLTHYRRVFGKDRWSFDAEGWRLIGLNALVMGAGDAEEAAQLVWLEGALKGWDGPLGVFLHKPLFRHGAEDAEIHHRYVPHEPRRRLLKMLADKDLRFVASGHTHQSRAIAVGGVEHLWAPSAAFYIPDLMQERIGDKTVGVTMLTLTAEGHRFERAVPRETRQLDLADHTDVYPDLVETLARARREKGGQDTISGA